jgi:hypothetical protein
MNLKQQITMQTESQQQYVKDTFEEYLGKHDHVSASDIKTFLKSPLGYYYQKNIAEKKQSEGRHFSIGSALHEIILEPELFITNYVVAPKFDKRTKEGKLNFEMFELHSANKTILFEDEMDMIKQIADNAVNNKTFVELLKNSYRELSFYTVDDKTGIKLRMRPDIMPIDKSTLVDIKSCTDSSPRSFKSDVYKYGYSVSAAFYGDFLKRENYVFAAMEKQPPYQVALYSLDDDMMEYGRKQYRMGLDLLRWSIDNNYWCNYNEFEILKECYELQNLNDFFDILEKSEAITILK